jgi:cytochrome c
MRAVLALFLAFALSEPAFAAGDEQNGKVIFAQCATCHSLDPGAEALGPHLKDLIGRKAGSVEGYVYSPPMRRSSVTWTAETLDGFLVDPQAVVPGTKMPFSGLPTAKDREDLIAYLSAP